jgi:hypothetical protein
MGTDGGRIACLAAIVVFLWAPIGADYQYVTIDEQEVDLIFPAPGDLCRHLERCQKRLMR